MNIEINDEKQLVNMMVEGAKALIMKEDKNSGRKNMHINSERVHYYLTNILKGIEKIKTEDNEIKKFKVQIRSKIARMKILIKEGKYESAFDTAKRYSRYGMNMLDKNVREEYEMLVDIIKRGIVGKYVNLLDEAGFTENEKNVIKIKYGGKDNSVDYSDIAKQLKLSRTRVRVIEEYAFNKIRHYRHSGFKDLSNDTKKALINAGIRDDWQTAKKWRKEKIGMLKIKGINLERYAEIEKMLMNRNLIRN